MALSRGAPGARGLVAAGAVASAVGVAVAALAPVLGTPGSDRTRPQELLGGIVCVAGWAILAWGIHGYGRGR